MQREVTWPLIRRAVTPWKQDMLQENNLCQQMDLKGITKLLQAFKNMLHSVNCE